MSLSSREKANLTRWNGREKPFYEVYYLKWCDPSQSAAAWIRYTLLAPLNREPEVSVWAMFFDIKDPSKNAALKKTFPLQESRIEREIFYFAPGSSAIFDDGARGELSDGNHRATWDLVFQEKNDPLWYFPRLLYKTVFPKTKFVVPYLSTRLSGEFTWNERRFLLSNAAAHQGHLWGTESAESWNWANANLFEEDPSFCFEGLSARVRLGARLSPPLTLLFFQWEGKLYKCNSPWKWFTSRSEPELDRWHFEATSGGFMFVGDGHVSTDRMIVVRYEDPAGGERFSHHAESADMRIQILKKAKWGWETVKTLTCRGAAAFEAVRPSRDPRVRLLLP